jgi:nucleoside-diphosphate-sugar epimerase
MSNAQLHLVLGAGQIGPLVAERLLARGLRVRIARKSAAPSRLAGVETVAIDVRDPAAVAKAAEGAAVVYHCANPLYHQWQELLLPMTRGIVEGSARAGARLVVLDNLYMYGDTARMHEEAPVAPVSKKGALRAEAAKLMLDADARGDLRVAIGRAADFFGPDAPLGAAFGERFFRRVLAGKSGECLGDPDMPHAYSYTPDVAAGLVALGLAPRAEDARGVWMLPVQPAESTRAVIGRFAEALGRTIGASTVPTWILRAMGLLSPVIREVVEMTYQWRQPFAVDDAKFRAAFGFGATAWDEAIGATAAWGRAAYGAPGAKKLAA